MDQKTSPVLPSEIVASDIDNIRELLEMLMSEHTPAKHPIKMKTNFGWEPPMDVFDTETEFVVIMDIAGMDRKDISVFIPPIIIMTLKNVTPNDLFFFIVLHAKWVLSITAFEVSVPSFNCKSSNSKV